MTQETYDQLRSGALLGARQLRLACGLQTFPHEIFALADTLELLDLSGNALSSLPDELPRMSQLRVLFCSSNQFSELPAVIGQCPNLRMVGFKANRIDSVPAAALPPTLRWLILTDNRIAELPDSIGACTGLQKLMLAGNRLRTLPAALANCSQLELLRVAANRLEALPDWLLEMPRLSWLAYAGNALANNADCAAGLPSPAANVSAVPWSDLVIGERLGEGASGVIHAGEWLRGDGRQSVAIKCFKGAVTSDGLPDHEMNACLAAGAHPHLVPVLGRVDAVPDGGAALVMGRLDRGFRNLAGPPSLESCTRDVYAVDSSFSLAHLLRLATAVAAAVAHLHARGILHGDLYAHNILHHEADGGRVLLGDFGAASFLDEANPPQAAALQRLEVRAFACLLDELLARCRPAPVTAAGHAVLAALRALHAECAQDTPAARPLFAEIHARLVDLASRPDLATAEL